MRNLEALNCLLECRNRDGAAIVIIGLTIGSVMVSTGGNGGAVKSAARRTRKIAREEEEARRGVRAKEGDDERERKREDGHECGVYPNANDTFGVFRLFHRDD